MADMEGGDILIRIRGDASELESEISRAQDALGELEGSAGDTEDGLGGMGSAATKTSQAFKGLSQGGVRGLAGGLRAVNPEMGAALSAFSAMQRALPALTTATNVQAGATTRLSAAFKGLLVSLGPIGVTLIAAVAAYQAVEAAISDANEKLEEQNRQLEINAERHKKINRAVSTLEQLERDTARQLALATGEMTKQQAALIDFSAEVDRATDALIREVEASDLSEESQRSATAGINARAAALKNQNAQLSDTIAAQEAVAASAYAEAAARRAAAAAAKEQAAAARETAAVQKERDAAITAHVETMQGLLEEIRLEVTSELDAVVDNLDAAFSELERQTIAGQQAMAQGITDSLAAVSMMSGLMADKMADDNEKAAMRAFRVSQAAAVAQIGINTASAIVRQYADLPAPAALISSIGIGALGAAQAAVVLAQPPPVAHIGTGMPGSRDPLAPDERISSGRRVLTTEASGPAGVANSMGTQLLNDVNTGRVQSSGRITAVIGRGHLDQELFRSGRRGTSRYARSLRTNPHPKPQGGY